MSTILVKENFLLVKALEGKEIAKLSRSKKSAFPEKGAGHAVVLQLAYPPGKELSCLFYNGVI